MVVFPNCKINLGLNITHKRSDGYHDLETVFCPVPLCDALEIIHQPAAETKPEIAFSGSGIPIAGNEADNLCVKAYQLLKKDFPTLPAVQMHLHKHIPMGAGLGGGSSDGAFALSLLNQKFQLNLTEEQLINYALKLGSDCPFFIVNKPCYATGRGEIMEPVELSLKGYYLLLINQGIHISTQQAFAGIVPSQPKMNAKEIVALPVEEWKHLLVNDFERTAFELHTILAEIKTRLYNTGAVYASMTGSGSTMFGIYKNAPVLEKNYWGESMVFGIDL